MTQNYLRYLATAVLAYLAFYLVSVPVVGYAAAIATPQGYFDWFEQNGVIWLGLFAWNLVTVIPVTALTAFCVSFLATRYTQRNWAPLALLLIAAHLIRFYTDLALDINEHPQMMELNGWRLFVPGIAPIIFMSLGCWFGQRLRDRAGRSRAAVAHAL